MKKIGIIALLLSLAAPVLGANGPGADGKPHAFALHDRQFWVDGTQMRVMAGEMHPGRILPEFWEDRIKKAKAMGLNTVSIYLFWNEIEPTEGNFVFKDKTDIRRFVKLCQDNGMWVLLRSGPYVCGEIDFGGLPAWLLKKPGMRIRANEPEFMAACKTYVDRIGKELADLQVAKGGPILMTQIENEYQGIDAYLAAVQKLYIDAGFDGQLFTCDPSGGPWTTLEYLPNVLRGYNSFDPDPNQRFPMRYAQSLAVTEKNGFPIFSPEVYTGWLPVWGFPMGKNPKVDLKTQETRIQFLFDHKDAAGKPDLSWCLYLFNGGTNFGFSAGPNGSRPVTTSYDYDAPVDELGRITPKYKMLRDMYARNLDLKLPDMPADPAIIEIPEFTVKPDAALVDRLPAKAIDSDNVASMENFDQNYGFIDYRKVFPDGIHGNLDSGTGRDYISIMVNGKVIQDKFSGVGGVGGGGFGRGGRGPGAMPLAIDVPGPATLDILVHNLGRNSLTKNADPEHKGLLTNPSLAGTPLTGWKIYPLPLEDPAQLPMPTVAGKLATNIGPTFYSATFNLPATGETYLDMSNFHFGVVWVNGHNLGRYWEVGATRCIYLPSPWQKKGDNQITVLELGPAPVKTAISGSGKMLETPLKAIQPLWTAAASAPAGRGN